MNKLIGSLAAVGAASLMLMAAVGAAVAGPLAEPEKCTPSADEYFGTRLADGVCHPVKKSLERYFDRNNDCTPDLQGRGRLLIGANKCDIEFERLPCTPPAEAYHGMWGKDGKCYPIGNLKGANNSNDCTPDLHGRGELAWDPPTALARGSNTPWGEDAFVCEIIYKFTREPRSAIDDLQEQIDDLKNQMDKLKSDRH